LQKGVGKRRGKRNVRRNEIRGQVGPRETVPEMATKKYEGTPRRWSKGGLSNGKPKKVVELSKGGKGGRERSRTRGGSWGGEGLSTKEQKIKSKPIGHLVGGKGNRRAGKDSDWLTKMQPAWGKWGISDTNKSG